METSVTTDEELNVLDSQLRRLKIEYEIFFSNPTKRPPTDIEWKVLSLLRKFSDGGRMNFSQRYRYNEMAQRYAVYSDLWRKKSRIREEGYRRPQDALLSVQGPRSREILQRLSPDDWSDPAFPYLTAQKVELGYTPLWALRVTYVGELGWDLLVPTEFGATLYDQLREAGADLGFRPTGLGALETMRLEKAFRDMGHDIDSTDTPIEAGLGFAVAWDKPGGFIGRDAALAQKALGTPTKRLVQVLANLLDNAIKYTPEGGQITVAARRIPVLAHRTTDGPRKGVELTVTDTGIGIPEKDRPRVFERFYRVDKARSRELGGTGLGLAIVKHIVEGHGGQIRMEGNVPNGSRFVVRLPAEPE